MNRIGLRRILQFLLPSAALFWTMLFVMPCALAQESAAEQGLVFSEAQSNNDTEWALGFRDYVELFNGSDSVVMLSDYYLAHRGGALCMPSAGRRIAARRVCAFDLRRRFAGSASAQGRL